MAGPIQFNTHAQNFEINNPVSEPPPPPSVKFISYDSSPISTKFKAEQLTIDPLAPLDVKRFFHPEDPTPIVAKEVEIEEQKPLIKVPLTGFFEGLTIEQRHKIEQADESQSIQFTQWIKEGDWRQVIDEGKKVPEIEYLLMRAHAEGRIDIDEIATALMFIDIAMGASCYKIAPRSGTRPHLCYELLVVDRNFYYPYFEVKDFCKSCPSFPILQKLAQKKNGFTLYPVFGLSNQEQMIDRFGKRESDFALIKPGTSCLVHGVYKRGFEFYEHDLAHLDLRGLLSPEHFEQGVELIEIFTNCLNQLPPFKSPLIDVEGTVNPMIDRNCAKTDQQRYLFYLARGDIIDGFYRPELPICPQEIKERLSTPYEISYTSLYFRLPFMDPSIRKECFDMAISYWKEKKGT